MDKQPTIEDELAKQILELWGYGAGPFLIPENSRESKLRNESKIRKYHKAVEHANKIAKIARVYYSDLQTGPGQHTEDKKTSQ